MVSKAAVVRQTVLLSGAISVFPLVLYPSTMGLPEVSLNPLWAIAEWALYTMAYVIMLPKRSLRNRIVAGAVTVGYRVAVAAMMGGLVSMMHGTPLVRAIGFCMWSYLPALVLHVAFAPFVLRPILGRAWRRGVRFAIDSGRESPAARTPGGFSFAAAASGGMSSRSRVEPGEVSFDAATAWVGEYSGVRMALVADEDGLVVSRWSRQTYSQDEEYWAAVAVEMVRFHQRQPGGVGTLDLRRLEVETASGRLTIRRAGLFWLAVLTEAEAGDLVSVRIVQAVEMIEKHYHDRYRAVRPAGLEVAHVSSAAGAEQNVGHYRQHAGSR